MPELPEVETVRRVMADVLVGRKIVSADVADDSIVLKKVPPTVVQEAIVGSTVEAVGRWGKYWWLELDRMPWLFGHLGMAGWVRDITPDDKAKLTTRLREHGKKDWDGEDGLPRYLKLLLETDKGGRIAFTDGRRLGRLWLANSAQEGVIGLGPDVLNDPWKPKDLAAKLKGRTAPIKALLLDQKLFAGVGNWIADEVLFQARIAPAREAGTLSEKEIKKLLAELKDILELAVSVNANSDDYPDTWLFGKRWGGARGKSEYRGHTIVRQPIGGRTTAWVPDLQK